VSWYSSWAARRSAFSSGIERTGEVGVELGERRVDVAGQEVAVAVQRDGHARGAGLPETAVRPPYAHGKDEGDGA